ncbi:MAG TPA: IS21-like element helper ATPase IstB [Bacteroidales bacterium]|nr:IS21-like element helper ATPase IstB [Bacteroidales bacterium]
MSNNHTMEKMKEMRFMGMQRAFETILQTGRNNDLTGDELVSYLVEAEWTDRMNRKTERLIKSARFRYTAQIENVNYSSPRNIDKNILLRLADCQFIEKGENIIITGATGVGKSYLASAFGYQACLKGYKVMYLSLGKLFSSLKISKADGSYMKELNKIEKQDLIIIDDFGLQPIDKQNQFSLLDVIEDRHAKRSTIFTSQIPIDKWHGLIEDSTIADAILDRVVHTAHRIDLKGESMRKIKKE